MREQGHVAVAECYADAEATGRFSSNNVIFRIAYHQHIGNVDAQNFGCMLKRQWAGFFLSQAVAAENQAEVAVEIKLFQQLGCQNFIFVGNDNQWNTQGLEQAETGFGFRVGAGKVAQVLAIIFHKEHKAFFPDFRIGFFFTIIGNDAMNQLADAVADITFNRLGGQNR